MTIHIQTVSDVEKIGFLHIITIALEGSRTYLLFTDGNKISKASFAADSMTLLTSVSGDLFAIDVDLG